MKAKLLTLYAVITLSILLGIAFEAELSGFIQSYMSTSPSNPGLYGAKYFYDAASERWPALLAGGPEDLLKPEGRIVFVVIGPDKPFTLTDAQALESLAAEGRLKLVVMDETIVSNWLLERLVGARVSGEDVISLDTPPGWQYIVRFDCGQLGSGISSRPSYVAEAPPGSQVLCWLDTGEERLPLAVLVPSGPVPALIVSDSSLCSNFLIEPPRWLGQSNLDVCLGLLESIVEPGDVLVFDNYHYQGVPIHFQYGEAALRLVALPGRALESMWNANPTATLALFLVFSLVASLLVSRPWRPSERQAPWSQAEVRMVLGIVDQAARRDTLLRLLYRLGPAVKLHPVKRLAVNRARRIIGGGG